MASKEENKIFTATEVASAERDLFLGKLNDDDEILGTGKTVSDLREDYKKADDAFQKEKEARRAAVLAKRQGNRTQTTLVTHGLMVEQTVENANAQTVAESKLLSKTALKKLSTAELISYAVGRGIEVKANVDSEADIIAKLYGEYVDKSSDTETKETDVPQV